ncbi:FAD-binding protein [Amycolatopsis sp. w19]|uniref:FAD-binding protein n=1 Tax=Amycolatopsis sp. w19 TaxID=3448134 RepID=UPI003F1B6968
MTDEILPAIAGEILTGDAALSVAGQDWGKLIHARPGLVVRPASVTDVAVVLRFAAARGLPVAARGAGHSPYGQGQVEGGIVLDMTSLPPRRVVTGDLVSVDAGARWREVLETTLPHGLAPPVLTDYLELTVAGTLVVGGIGGATLFPRNERGPVRRRARRSRAMRGDHPRDTAADPGPGAGPPVEALLRHASGVPGRSTRRGPRRSFRLRGGAADPRRGRLAVPAGGGRPPHTARRAGRVRVAGLARIRRVRRRGRRTSTS